VRGAGLVTKYLRGAHASKLAVCGMREEEGELARTAEFGAARANYETYIYVCPALQRSVSVIVVVCQLNGCDMQPRTSKHPLWHIPQRCSMNTQPLSRPIHD
jgi:hypothetical protein